MRLDRLPYALAIGGTLGALIRTLPPHVYGLDLTQDWLAARAWRDGLDPLAVTRDLATLYLPESIGAGIGGALHPSPHPPWLAIPILPLSYLPFPIAALLWLALSLTCVHLAGRRLRLSVPLAILAWPALFLSVDFGQWEALILLLAVTAWSAAEKRQDSRAGLLLGLAAAIKLYPAALLLPFVLARRPRLIAYAALAFLGSQAFALVVVGPLGLVRYWTEVLPAVSATYMGLGLYISTYAAVNLFAGSPLAIIATVLVTALGVYWLRGRPARDWVLILPLACPTAALSYMSLAAPALLGFWRDGHRLSLALAVLGSSAPVLAPILCLVGPLVGLSVSGALALIAFPVTLAWLGLIAATRPTTSPTPNSISESSTARWTMAASSPLRPQSP